MNRANNIFVPVGCPATLTGCPFVKQCMPRVWLVLNCVEICVNQQTGKTNQTCLIDRSCGAWVGGKPGHDRRDHTLSEDCAFLCHNILALLKETAGYSWRAPPQSQVGGSTSCADWPRPSACYCQVVAPLVGCVYQWSLSFSLPHFQEHYIGNTFVPLTPKMNKPEKKKEWTGAINCLKIVHQFIIIDRVRPGYTQLWLVFLLLLV